MSNQNRVDWGNGFSTNESGDLIYVDQESKSDIVVVKKGFVTPEAMSHVEGSKEWSVHYSHTDLDGKVHQTSHSLSDLHLNPKLVVSKFLLDGLGLMAGMVKLLILFLLSHLPEQRFLRVRQSGWLENSWVYIQPNWTAGDAGEHVHLELENNCPTISSMCIAGTLTEWQSNVASPLRGNPVAMFCVADAFLGPLQKPLGIEPGGVNLVGPSSVGKSSVLGCSASVYGKGSSSASDHGRSYVQTWNQSSNGLEGIAAAHTDALVAIDEIGLYAGNDLGADLYSLSGGRGKGVMNSQRELMGVKMWCCNILSTGEMGVIETIERRGGKAKAGMLVRMIDVPVTNAFPNPPDGKSSGELSNLLKTNCGEYYGIAGYTFVKFLVDQLQDDPDAVIAALRATLDQFTSEMTPADASPIQQRAVRRFAAIRVAGHAAIEAGVLPYTTDEVDSCVAEVISTWLRYKPTVTDVQRSLAVLQDFLIRNATSFPGFIDLHACNPKGFRDSSRGLMAFTDNQFATATGSTNVVEVAKELRRLGFLFCNERGRLKAKQKISGDTETRFYIVKRAFLEADFQRTDVDAEVVLGNAEDGTSSNDII